ncbi:hypothetical protein KHQ81_12425 [Mycoplasmatota bacterium]|nr:hypothetical protein KHQ81_12425 [Mycoplasmatota bacterium]
MNKYNKNLIEATKNISQNTLSKSMDTVEKLIHPSKKVSFIGSVIGNSIGVGLIVVGSIGVVLERNLFGIGCLIVGGITIVSNVININKTKK